MVTARKKILWVDDDTYFLHPYILKLEDDGYEVVTATTVSDGKSAIEANDFAAVVMDVMLPPGEIPHDVSLKAGFESGLVLGRWIKNHYPNVPIIGFSAVRDGHIVDWFERHAGGYLSKFQTDNSDRVVEHIKSLIDRRQPREDLRVFIVHGHDEETKYELKNFVQNTLKLGEPIILHEQPSQGRTIIEKFEDLARNVNLVFVVLTPDDLSRDSSVDKGVKYRSRQNVILEMGYFLAKLGRQSGRVLLLYKGDLQLPSDISGLIYIDITNGINAAGEAIRRELGDLIT